MTMPALRPARILRTGTAALVAAVLCVVMLPSPASAQNAPDTPSVGVTPTESRDGDPNRGQWFVFSIEPGQRGATNARIGNPADVPQTIKLYFADLTFGTDGTPTVNDGAQEGIGAWAKFDRPSITVAPKSFALEPFHIDVPDNAEPGDHVGVLVAESAPSGGLVKIVKRIATRVYVTVPGEATKSFVIEKLATSRPSMWWPGAVDVTTTLRNTGRIRLHPTVLVKGSKATGPDTLLARSIETYQTRVRIPWYGGPVKIPVQVNTDAGITHTVSKSMFVIPWGPLAMIPVILFFGLLVRWLWRLRTRKMRRLQADLRRLEQLVAKRPTGVESNTTPTNLPTQGPYLDEPERAAPDGGDGHDAEEADDRVRSIRAGLKRARRGRSTESFERLALALHDTGEDALDELVEALQAETHSNRAALVAAAASYGASRIASHSGVATLPAEVTAAISAITDPAPSPAPARKITRGPRPAPPAGASGRAPRTRKPTAPRGGDKDGG